MACLKNYSGIYFYYFLYYLFTVTRCYLLSKTGYNKNQDFFAVIIAVISTIDWWSTIAARVCVTNLHHRTRDQAF